VSLRSHIGNLRFVLGRPTAWERQPGLSGQKSVCSVSVRATKEDTGGGALSDSDQAANLRICERPGSDSDRAKLVSGTRNCIRHYRGGAYADFRPVAPAVPKLGVGQSLFVFGARQSRHRWRRLKRCEMDPHRPINDHASRASIVPGSSHLNPSTSSYK